MDRMEHFRGARLKDKATEKEILSNVEGFLGQHMKGSRMQWHGYFELAKDQHVPSGVHLLLVLPDNRVADLIAAEVRDSNSPGKTVHIAEFYVTGEPRLQKRGLRDPSMPPRHTLT